MDTLRSNLAALAVKSPSLAARLHLPVASDHVRLPTRGDDRPPAYRHQRALLPLGLSPKACADLLASAEVDKPLMLFGLGLGEMLDAALALPAREPIVAWERDPWLLRLCLAGRDLREPIASGRLQLAMSADLLDRLPWPGAVVSHPLATRIYPLEAVALEHGLGEHRALLVTGELFVDDLADALRERGFGVMPWEVTRHAREELLHVARKVAPRLVVAVNYTQGLAELCSELHLPLLCWEVDPATDHPRKKGAVHTAHVFTYRRAQVAWYERAGFSSVRYLPLAANPARRRAPAPPPDPRFQAPISFVGASMVANSMRSKKAFVSLYALWKGMDLQHTPSEVATQARELLERILSTQRTDRSRNLVPGQVDALCQGWRAWARELEKPDPAMLAAEVAAAEKRLSIVANLGALGIRVWGDQGWKLTSQHGVRPMGRAGHGKEINAIYAGSLVNLDVNRLYQPDIVTMRVFDVLACGGFVLAEHNDAIEELFEPGVHLDCWRDTDELLAKARHYIAHPDEARRIARAGRERVLRQHTVTQRLETMLQVAGLD